jgi:aminoglycoside 3-N-acetyltransferase
MAYAGWNSAAEDLVDEDGRVLDAWREHLAPFDITQSRAVRANGVLPEFLRTTPGAYRSANPGASMVALGARADWFCADHPMDYGYGPGSPLAKLVEAQGRVLMAGAPWDTMTLIHHADHLADLPSKRVMRYEVPTKENGHVIWRFIEEFDTTEPVVDGMPETYIEDIVTAFVGRGHGQQGLVGQAPSLLVDAEAMLHFAINWLETWSAVPVDAGPGDAGPNSGSTR